MSDQIISCAQAQTILADVHRLKREYDDALADYAETVQNYSAVDGARISLSAQIEHLREGMYGPERRKRERAKEIMGKEYIGPEVVDRYCGVGPEKDIPSIPFSEAELERALELGQFLILRVSHEYSRFQDDPDDPYHPDITMSSLADVMNGTREDDGDMKPILEASEQFFVSEDFFRDETPRAGWALVGKDCLVDSFGKNYLRQTSMIEGYLRDEVFQGYIPADYGILEFLQYARDNFVDEAGVPMRHQQVSDLLSGDQAVSYAKALTELKINQACRQTPVEALYDYVMYYNANQEEIAMSNAWTNRCDSEGKIIAVGRDIQWDDSEGWELCSRDPGPQEEVGFVFARRF